MWQFRKFCVKSPIKFLLIFIALLSATHLNQSHANNGITLNDASGRLISNIIIQGNKKTQASVIKRELSFSVGNRLAKDIAEESLRRLKNLRIFDKVEFEYYLNPDNTINIHIFISDRWTIIPIFKFGGGGGVTYYTIGAYDVNSFGKYLELGSQYQNINGKSGGVVWFRNPRFLNQRLLLGMDLWHFMLNQPTYNDDANLSGAYNNTKSRLHFFVNKQASKHIFIGMGIDYVIDKFNEFGLSDNQLDANQEFDFQIPKNAKQNFVELNFQLSELNYDRYLVEGQQLNIDSRITNKQFFSDDSSIETTIKATHFSRFKYQQNIGLNFVAGHTTSKLLQNQFFLGGLFEVRGYVDRRFTGSDYWKSNIEYRIPSYRSKWFVLQHVAFIDFGRIANSTSDLFSSKSTKFASAGGGFRFISPKIYRFNARLDFARTFGKQKEFDISFGLQQFF